METIETVRLTDGAGQATATVFVLSGEPRPLTISPSSLGGELRPSEQVVFTASNGVPPYSFRLEGDEELGTLEIIAPNKARYTAPAMNTLNWVYLSDAVGHTVRVKVKTRK